MFDVAVLAVIGVLTLFGVLRGLVRQVVGFAGVIAGCIFAMKFYGPLAAKFLAGFSPVTGHIISFLAIFMACIIAASVVGWMTGRLVSSAGLGILNRIGGGLLGGAKGCLIVAVVTMLLIAFLPPNNGVLRGGTLIYIQPLAGLISTFAPKSINTKYDEKSARMGRPRDTRKKETVT
jgi:membrane protein required for colicin V production